MGLTEDRLRTTRAPRIARPPDASRGWRLALMAAWLVLFPLGVALEPMPAADAPEPWWAMLPALALLGAVVATFVGLARSKRWGVGASLLASTIFVTGVFACPATGHHAFGLWWIGEFAIAVALVAISGVAYLRTRA